MPEIGEVARIVHFIRKRLVGKTLAVVKAQHDENVFGKAGTSAAELEKCLTGKKVEDAGQQGKYFWLIMSSPPHPVLHFGMAGWFRIRDEDTAFYKLSKPAEPTWPPKHWKFTIETAEKPKCEAAFVDYRRFGRIRLVDCAGGDIRRVSPLKENGPDPVLDQDVVTEAWLTEKLAKKKVPIKALLLDQAVISGIGNWVGDEILFNAHIHPEQYSNTLSTAQVSQLYKSLHYVVSHAVDNLVEWDSFPESWLFKHRWDKGKKNSPSRLANGAKIEFVTVGGRTSALVPSVQKKTGPVAGDVKDEANGEDDEEVEPSEEIQPKKKSKGTVKKEANLKPATKPTATKKPDENTHSSTLPVRKQSASASRKNREPADPPRQENATKPSKPKKRQLTNPPSPTNEPSPSPSPSNAHTTPAKKPPSASKKRALKPEVEDEVAEARGQKKSKAEASAATAAAAAAVDQRPRRRSARVIERAGLI